ncbi:hypothetical protein KO02_01485 [Sphingobacterium sp. ML3W]|uniref:lanthionine synthetase C family protein n=1 Tax=Sphingobacterium sp. ML3W TaxID=1538644 RepID=UPI0004F670D0|nr:lanthionine synthetase C family protein [Sphingobacterium sp. ML3W]AIM35477.1 hypothetical protein KO02_01485 [Sphingobacterium sp. ML3W]
MSESITNSQVVKTVYRIKDTLQKKRFKNISLMDGLPGSILFNFYFGQVFNCNESTAFSEKSAAYLVNKFNDLESFPFGYGNGLTGVLSFFNYMSDKSDIYSGLLDESLDRLVAGYMMERYKKGDYDYMFGGAGGMKYLLERYAKNQNEYLKNLITQGVTVLLNDLLIDENEEVAFWNISKREDINLISSKPINIGFAHGIPGIISLLLDCVQFDICKIEIQKILEKVFRFILKYRNISGLSQFPKYANIVNGNDNFSPLAWCYGDIGISISLLKYGAACAKDEFFEMGTNIGLQACNRRSVRESGVLDAGFCHGTSGLSCQYNILHKYTGHSDFLKSQEYWLKKTIEYSNFDKHSVAGFRMYIDDDLWQPSFGLLNGIAGIGLTFLNYIEPEIVDWRTFFNLPKL